MNKLISLSLLLLCSYPVIAQPTFKAGWNTYSTGSLTHEYYYNFVNNDTGKMTLVDSALVFASTDSLVTLTVHIPFREKSVYKTINYFNTKKQILKTEELKDDNLLEMNEWRYDEKNRKIYHYEDNKTTGNNFRHTFDYSTDKKNGDIIVSQCSYFNGRIEFYTKTYYDKNSVKYKEVRYNDNNKDIVHIETFYYGDNGKLKERSVYFPEWKVTKKFEEKAGSQVAKCYRCLPVGTAEKITIANKVPFIKRLIIRNTVLLMDQDCDQFEYIFKNFTNCDITLTNTNLAHTKRVIFRYKEKY